MPHLDDVATPPTTPVLRPPTSALFGDPATTQSRVEEIARRFKSLNFNSTVLPLQFKTVWPRDFTNDTERSHAELILDCVNSILADLYRPATATCSHLPWKTVGRGQVLATSLDALLHHTTNFEERRRARVSTSLEGLVEEVIRQISALSLKSQRAVDQSVILTSVINEQVRSFYSLFATAAKGPSSAILPRPSTLVG
eukprot:m.317383 g.317383  ORF g.317383 m.317383 type:complete len:198 (+) comp55472_c0_seq7:366-959(+)